MVSAAQSGIMVQAVLHSSGAGGWPIVAAYYIQMCLWEPNLLWFLSCYLPILSWHQHMVYSVWMLSYFLTRWCLWNKWNLGIDAVLYHLFSLCRILLPCVIRLVPNDSWYAPWEQWFCSGGLTQAGNGWEQCVQHLLACLISLLLTEKCGWRMDIKQGH